MSVILCTYNRRAVLEESIASFEKQTAARGSFELIVVDDGSSDGTHEWLSSRGLCVPGRIVRRENGGLSAARNSGIAVARGKRLLLVNDDTIAFPDLVEQHLRVFHELGDDKVSILGTFEQPARALDNALMRMLERSTEVFCYASMKPRSFHDWTRFWTCNVSVSHALVRAIGGFDESFRHYGAEDTDLALRLDARGSRVWFEDTARAHHRHLLDFDALERRQLTVARAWVRLFKKHPRAMEHPDWTWVRALDLRECQRYADARNPDLYGIERAARALSVLDVGVIAGHSAAVAAADAICTQLGALIAELNRVWWRQGFAAGLVEHGFEAFREMLPLDPWPLATSADHAVIAWPQWKTTELEHMLATYGQSLADRDDVCLVLRHDGACDPPLDLARAALVEAYENVFEPTTSLQVLVLDDALNRADLARVGRSVRAAIALPSSTIDPRSAWLRALNVASVSTRSELEKQVGAPLPAPAIT
jgi:glycosyltransferase involved in cell wall biosynthesis